MPLGNPHLSRRSKRMMRGSRWVKPQWRPATSGIPGLDSAARPVNQDTLPRAKHTQTYTAHATHTHPAETT